MVGDWLAEPMHQSSADYASTVNEMEKVGLTPIPSVKVKPPRVKESAVHFECRLEQLIAVGEAKVGGTTLVIGRILAMHIFDEAYVGGRILYEKLRPIARLGGRSYCGIGEIFSLWEPRAD